MPVSKVFYCLLLLTLLDATSQIRPSLHGHNNVEDFMVVIYSDGEERCSKWRVYTDDFMFQALHTMKKIWTKLFREL